MTNPAEYLYKVVIPYRESANPNKRFKIEYSIEAPNREIALKRAEREFMGYTQYSSASWVRILDRENLRAWRLLPNAPQTVAELDQLAVDLNTLDPDTLYNVLKALGELEDTSHAPAIRSLLSHANPDLAALAAETLGKIGDRDGFSDLVKAYGPESHPVLKACILSSLGRLAKAGDPIEEVAGQALGDTDARVRANAVELVEKLKLSGILRQLVPMLSDEDNRVRANVLKALWNSHDRAALLRTLREMIAAPNRWMRISAAFVLQHIDLEERPGLLEQILRDPDPDVHAAARTTLFRLNDRACIPLLLNLLASHPEMLEDVKKRLEAFPAEDFFLLPASPPLDREHARTLRKLGGLLGETLYRRYGFLLWMRFKLAGFFSPAPPAEPER
jgi:HEAT repeat protein